MFSNVPQKSSKKILSKPYAILHELELHFSLFDKLNVVMCSTHPYIYNFFSHHDSCVYVAKDRHGTYSLRGYYPKSFKLPYPDVIERHSMYDVLYISSELRLVQFEFEKFVEELIKFYYFNPSYNSSSLCLV